MKLTVVLLLCMVAIAAAQTPFYWTNQDCANCPAGKYCARKLVGVQDDPTKVSMDAPVGNSKTLAGILNPFTIQQRECVALDNMAIRTQYAQSNSGSLWARLQFVTADGRPFMGSSFTSYNNFIGSGAAFDDLSLVYGYPFVNQNYSSSYSGEAGIAADSYPSANAVYYTAFLVDISLSDNTYSFTTDLQYTIMSQINQFCLSTTNSGQHFVGIYTFAGNAGVNSTTVWMNSPYSCLYGWGTGTGQNLQGSVTTSCGKTTCVDSLYSLYPFQNYVGVTQQGTLPSVADNWETNKYDLSSTDLYSAIPAGIKALQNQIASANGTFGGTPVYGNLVVISDFLDTAGRSDLATMSAAVSDANMNSKVGVYAIGINAASNYVEQEQAFNATGFLGRWNSVGPTGGTAGGLSAIFSSLAGEFNMAYLQSHAFLQYCTPRRAGSHILGINFPNIPVGGGNFSKNNLAFSAQYDATKFTPNANGNGYCGSANLTALLCTPNGNFSTLNILPISQRCLPNFAGITYSAGVMTTPSAIIAMFVALLSVVLQYTQ